MSIISSTQSGKIIIWKVTLERKTKIIVKMLDSIIGCKDAYVKMKYTYPFIFISSFGKKRIGIAEDEICFDPKKIYSQSDVKDKILDCFKKNLEPNFDIESVNWDFVTINYRL